MRIGAYLVLLFIASISADVYMHNPRGSNNKLNEQSNTRDNANRLFDSQNNNNGGYQVGDACIPNCLDDTQPQNQNYNVSYPGAGKGIMQYYEGSELYIEWTNQHGCGAFGEVNCNMVLQYSCDDDPYTSGMRDGVTTQTIPLNPDDPNIGSFGQHENYAFYQWCTTRPRNQGLYVADQNLQGTTAQFTRQNNNGQRFGYECPEERDYYPYWHYSPWRDIMICTSDTSMCGYYQSNSQNVADKGNCSSQLYNTQASCQANGFTWTMGGNFGMAAPNCTVCPTSRNNMLGDSAVFNVPPHYVWNIPEGIHADGAKCVVRIRYNITSKDFNGWTTDSLYNGKNAKLSGNPSKDFVGFGQNVTGPLQLAINTAQFPRTFEDRSHVFQIRKLPPGAKGWLGHHRIINLNVKGRRGNIVQVYPSHEIDFVPRVITANRGDLLHIQWTGADSNDQNNDGNGKAGTDRTNLVMMGDVGTNTPLNMNPVSPIQPPVFFTNNITAIIQMAFLNQTMCDPNTNNQQDNLNCKRLNRSPGYVNIGLIPIDNIGTFNYMNTRQNQFTNREMKGTLVVSEDWASVAAYSGVTVGGLALSGALIFVAFGYSRRNPQSKLRYIFGNKGATVNTSEFDDEEAEVAMGENKKLTWGERYPLLGKFLTWYVWERNRILFLAFFFFCNIVVWLYGMLANMNTVPDPYYPYAKGFGKTLDVNLGFLLLPVMRNFLSFVRTTSAADYLPLDDNITFHIISAVFIAIGGIGHVACHYADFVWEQNNKAVPIVNNALGTLPGITGHLIMVLMLMMYLTAMIKRKAFKWFNGTRFDGYRFFISVHRMWVLTMGFLLLHSQNIWPFLLWPLLLMSLEKFIQSRRKRLDVVVVQAHMAGKDVLSLKMRLSNKKNKFRYKAGQYLFLQCPDVSDEWHPFTITSAPEESFFSCHIRCRSDMDWTFRLRQRLGFAEKYDEFGRPTPARTSPLVEGDPDSPILKIDGPYGSASEEVFDHNVVVLVGAGIGVTPFVSVLKSISIRMKSKTDKELDDLTIYFYWICRDQNEFNSFKDIFDEVMENKFLASKVEINTYTTGEMDLKQVRLENYNQFSGKPNWTRILKEKAVKHEGETVGVFLCGPNAVATELSVACKKNSRAGLKALATTGEQGTIFKFFKENF